MATWYLAVSYIPTSNMHIHNIPDHSHNSDHMRSSTNNEVQKD